MTGFRVAEDIDVNRIQGRRCNVAWDATFTTGATGAMHYVRCLRNDDQLARCSETCVIPAYIVQLCRPPGGNNIECSGIGPS